MKNGMKQTEIGEIPAEWEVVKLGDIISDLKSGVSVNSEDKQISSFGEIGILKTSAIANGHFLPHQHKLVVDKDVQRAKLNPVGGSILISRMNTPALVGDSCYVGEDYPSLFIPDRLWMTVFNPKKKISSRWLSFVLVSDSFKEIIRNTATGTSNSMKNISKGSFLSLEVALPPLPEQRKIAEILSTLDEKMAVIDEQLAQTQELKKGLMQRLLTKGIGHTQFKDSPLGEIPASWELVNMTEVTRQIVDGTHFTPTYTTEGIPFLRVTDLKNKSIDFSSIKYVSLNEHEILIKRCKPERGDILYSKNGTIGIAKIVDWDWEFSVFVSLALIKPKPNMMTAYLFHFLNSDLVKEQIRKQAKQGAVTNLHLEEIRKFKVALPPLPEQRQIAEILTTVDDKIGVLQDKKAQYQTLKKGLMQQLLTGQRRVRVAAGPVAELV